MAYVMKDEADGAALVLQPVLNLPPDRRLATVTTRLLTELHPLLAASKIADCRAASGLREQVTDYCRAQPVINTLPAGENS
jgi:hypothetical protein